MAAGIALLAAALRLLAGPLLGQQMPFVLAFVAVVLSSLWWGTGAGLVAAMVSAAAAASRFLPPDATGSDLPIQLGGFLLASAFIALLCGQWAGQVGRQVGRQINDPVSTIGGPPTTPNETPHTVPETPLTAWLRAVLWGAFLVPTIAFLMVAWWGFERAQTDARAAASHASHLALEHAQHTLQVAEEVGRRADQAALGHDDSLRRSEPAIRQRLTDIVAGLPSVVNLNIWNRDGLLLATSETVPQQPGSIIADRPYFQQQRDAPVPVGISKVMIGRQSKRELMNLTLRRSSSDGAFNGIIAVALAPQFFRDYYRALLAEQPQLEAFGLIRTDGEILARWPPSPEGITRLHPDSPALRAVQGGAASGVVNIGASPGREARLVSFRRLDHYPVYVVASFSRSAAYAGWLRFLGLLAAILGPVTAVLVFVTWVALKKTRHEQATFAELQEEIRRRGHAERSMLENQKLETLAVLSGGVAHDFNNLLAIVSASLHVHKRKHPQVAEEPQMHAMGRAVESGVRLTRQLLSFSRKQALKPETVHLQTWLPNAEVLFRTSVGSVLRCEVAVAPDTAAISVDLAELELAIINLALNAKHASPDGGSFQLTARNARPDEGPAARFVVIEAKDEGIGIPADVLPRILEPFFTTRARGVGSGLGLSQVNGLCSQAGGFVRIESTVGAGTTVRLFFPATTDAALPAADAPEPAVSSLSGRVLLVEDNVEVAASLTVMLRGVGLDVIPAADARSAMHYLESSAVQPDVVLSDIAMPGSDSGIDLAFTLRQIRPQLPVLLTTGYADQLNKAIDGGFTVIPKPVVPQRLLAALKAAMASRPSHPSPAA